MAKFPSRVNDNPAASHLKKKESTGRSGSNKLKREDILEGQIWKFILPVAHDETITRGIILIPRSERFKSEKNTVKYYDRQITSTKHLTEEEANCHMLCAELDPSIEPWCPWLFPVVFPLAKTS